MFPHRKGHLAVSPSDFRKGAALESVRCVRYWTSIEALLPSWPLGAHLTRHTGRQRGRFRAAPFFLFLRPGIWLDYLRFCRILTDPIDGSEAINKLSCV